jgi:hypothetical protein
MNESRTKPAGPTIQEIIMALAGLNYPENDRLDAAKRLSWVPDLARDLIEFVRLDCPKFDPDNGQPHRTLLRPLQDGLTVSRLMTDYLQQPAGAFLLGAALITHHDEALGLLEKMIVNGIYIKKDNGAYANISVPAARSYPICRTCGTVLVHKAAFCGFCGSPTEIPPD